MDNSSFPDGPPESIPEDLAGDGLGADAALLPDDVLAVPDGATPVDGPTPTPYSLPPLPAGSLVTPPPPPSAEPVPMAAPRPTELTPPAFGAPPYPDPPEPAVDPDEAPSVRRTELTPPAYSKPPMPTAGTVGGPTYVRPPADIERGPLLPPPPPMAARRDPFAPSPSISLEASRQYARYPADPMPLPAPAPAPEPRPRLWRAVLLAALSAAVGAAVALGAFMLLDDDPVATEAAPPVTIIERVRTEIVGSGDEPSMIAPAVGRAVIPSIVTVEVDTVGGAAFIADGSGSGVVLDTAGHIVTNDHVVAGAETVRVVFADGRVYSADVVGTDQRTDLAVLLIDAIGLVPIEIGATTSLEIGDSAIAVGSPLGLEGGPSLTVGVISAFDRQVQTGPDRQTDILFGMLQTDAPITSGSSGGALVDSQGRLIGITSAIGVSRVGAEGIGFAIPVELVERVTAEIIETGEARHAFLGIGGETAFEAQADGAEVPVGVLVVSVEDGSAAGVAGLRVGDRITSLGGSKLVTMDGLIIALRNYRVGETVDLSIDRGVESLIVPVELGERGN